MTVAATHRVFDVINGLYPVTFANVREADPQHLLDIFEGADNTRDAYFDAVRSQNPRTAGWEWADALSGYFGGHDSDCDHTAVTHQTTSRLNGRVMATHPVTTCVCYARHRNDNQQWGEALYQDIQQRIRELNG